MFFVDLIFALVIALLLVTLVTVVFEIRGPWNNVLLFFLVILLLTWAGGVWLTPMGPTLAGRAWLPFLLTGIVVTLLLAAATIPFPKEGETVEFVDPKEQKARRWAAGAALTIFFWLALLLLVAAILFRYAI